MRKKKIGMIDFVLLCGAATFSITWVLVFEKGPKDYVDKFRTWFQDRYKSFGAVLDCPVCTAFWVALAVVPVGLLSEILLYIPAALAVAMVLFLIVESDDNG